MPELNAIGIVAMGLNVVALVAVSALTRRPVLATMAEPPEPAAG